MSDNELNNPLYAHDPKLAAQFEKDVKAEIQGRKTANQYAGLTAGLSLATTAAFAEGAAHTLQTMPDNLYVPAGLTLASLYSAYNAHAAAGDVKPLQPAQFLKGVAAASALSFALYAALAPTINTDQDLSIQNETASYIDQDVPDIPVDTINVDF